MSEKKVSIKVDVYSTYGGEDYAPGVHEVSKETAKSLIDKKLGSIVSSDAAAEELLAPREAFEKYLMNDSSDIVFASLRFHQATIAEEFSKNRPPIGEVFPEKPAPAASELVITEQGTVETTPAEPVEEPVTSEPEKTQVLPKEEDRLPADFPKRANFEKLGFKTVAEVQALSRKQLIELNGVGEILADLALAYGKN